jgi:hypothetical protein
MIRSGDVNLHIVKEAKGKVLEHNGSWVLAKGEATGSVHTLTVDNPEDLIVQQDDNGDMYYTLKSPGKISHTHNHETIIAQPEIYIQTPEREIDHFEGSVERKTID